MLLRACTLALLAGLMITNSSQANEAATAETPPPPTPVESRPAPAADQAEVANGRLHTLWEFQLDVTATQHEPAGKSLDRFETTLYFNALMPHDSGEVQKWSGYGTMTSKVLSRAASSDQAAHRPKPQFHMQANTYWDRIGKSLQINLTTKDAVTYSLKSGQVLGTTSILQYILPEAKGPKLIGNLQTFAIPTSTPAGAKFDAWFDTMGKHVNWYEGKATLKVISKREGISLQQTKPKDVKSAPAAKPGVDRRREPGCA